MDKFSVVIVTNKHGRVATLRFDNPKHDRIFSCTGYWGIYAMIERYVKEVQSV